MRVSLLRVVFVGPVVPKILAVKAEADTGFNLRVLSMGKENDIKKN